MPFNTRGIRGGATAELYGTEWLGTCRPRGPAHCDAKRVGEAARGSLKRRYPPKIFPKFFQNPPQNLPRTSQEPPKPSPNQARSTHETKEAPKKRPRAPKKRDHGAQERPNGAQEPPQTLQNGAMEGPGPNIFTLFSMLFFRSQICIDFPCFFIDFS